MNNFISAFLLLLVITFSFNVNAAPVETFKFDSPQMEATFHKLSDELRCLVCQNQNIAESNADLAKDLRLEIYTMLRQGKTEDEIVEFMVQRYGDYVLYRPPMKPMTWLLWFGPILVFFIAVISMMRFMKSQMKNKAPDDLSATDVERVKNLHAEQDNKH